MLALAYKNILETSTVSLTAGTADTNYPLYRLYDRNIGRLFKTTLAETTEIKVDQSASNNIAIDALIIPAGHNLSGMTLDIKYSTDDVTYTPAVTQWTQADNNFLLKTWNSVTARYWKFIITNPASIPEIPELFLTSIYNLERDPVYPATILQEHNVLTETTTSGQDRFLVLGSHKRTRQYNFKLITETQKNNMETFYNDYGSAYPFWLKDHTGTWIYGRLRSNMEIINDVSSYYSIPTFNFIEVLP